MSKDIKPSKAMKLSRAVETLRAQRPVVSSGSISISKPDSATRLKKSEIKFPNNLTALRRHVEEVRKADKPVVTAVRLRPRVIAEPILVERTEERRSRAAQILSSRKTPTSAPAAALASRAHALAVADEPAVIRTVLALGDVVRHARRRQSLSQAELASAAGTGRRFISDLEAGKPTLEFERLLKVCHALGITLLASETER